MWHPTFTLELLVDLSTEQQQFLCGGQNLYPVSTSPINPLRNAKEIGSETKLGNITLGGNTTSSPNGSLGISSGQGKGSATGASDSLILPPFNSRSETI
jgi:hypothetical protein